MLYLMQRHEKKKNKKQMKGYKFAAESLQFEFNEWTAVLVDTPIFLIYQWFLTQI